MSAHLATITSTRFSPETFRHGDLVVVSDTQEILRVHVPRWRRVARWAECLAERSDLAWPWPSSFTTLEVRSAGWSWRVN